MHTIETQFSRLTLCDDGVLEAHPIQREHPRTAALLSESLEAMRAVAGGQPRPVLWDPAGTLPLEPLGWRVIVEGVRGLFAALAIVLDANEEHLLGAFPQTMDSLLIPVRIFRSESEAREWLLQFVTAAPREMD